VTGRSEGVRDLLFDAIARGDDAALQRLCTRHREAIVEGFRDWRVPEAARADRAAVERWALSLIAIAQCLARQGETRPLESMVGGPRDNPAWRNEDAYRRAQALTDTGDFVASSGVLDEIVADMQGSIGFGVDALLAKVDGLAGTNWLRMGNLDRARASTLSAQERCRMLGDEAGVRVYEENLRAIDAATQVAGAGLRERTIEAQRLSDAARYLDSNRLLHVLVEDLARSVASQAELYRGKVLGLLGLNYHRLRDARSAEHWTRLAHDECQRIGDTFGTTIYSANLRAISAPLDGT
jgi:hypothetical protein